MIEERNDNIGEYFSGKKLYGDDFTIAEIEKWYADEVEGYANLGSKDKGKYQYTYHSMNKLYGFNHLPKDRVYDQVLGLGSAYGEEFLPIIDKIKNITIVEPSDNLIGEKVGDIPLNYSKPQIDGTLLFEDNQFDLIIGFSVLHHIPNVSYVLSELVRVLKPGGILILREPIVTMGDWREKRQGLTKNERGIPKSFFKAFIEKNNLKLLSESLCDCSFAHKVLSKVLPFSIKKDTPSYQQFDNLLSKALSWNYRYHRTNPLHKCGPASIFLIVEK